MEPFFERLAWGAGAEFVKRLIGFLWEKPPFFRQFAAESRVPADIGKELLFELANFHLPKIDACTTLEATNYEHQNIIHEIMQDLGKGLQKRLKPKWNPRATYLVPNGEVWKIKSHYGHSNQEIQSLDLKIDGSVAGVCFRRKDPLIVPNVLREQTYVRQRFDERTKSLVCVPVHCSHQVYGVLNCTSEKINAFSVADEGLMWMVASAIALVERCGSNALQKFKPKEG